METPEPVIIDTEYGKAEVIGPSFIPQYTDIKYLEGDHEDEMSARRTGDLLAAGVQLPKNDS